MSAAHATMPVVIAVDVVMPVADVATTGAGGRRMTAMAGGAMTATGGPMAGGPAAGGAGRGAMSCATRWPGRHPVTTSASRTSRPRGGHRAAATTWATGV